MSLHAAADTAAWMLPHAAASTYAAGVELRVHVPPFASTQRFAAPALVTVHAKESDADSAPDEARTTNVCGPWASEVYVTGLVHAVAAAPSSEHVTVAAFEAANANVALVEPVVAAGPDWIVTVGGGVTVQANESDAESPPDVALTAKMCCPTASAEYVSGLEHGVAAPPSSEHETADAFAAEKAKAAVVALVDAPGVDVIVTVG